MNTIAELNPYRGLSQTDPAETATFNARISREDYELIRTVCPLWGTIQTTVAIIVSEVAQTLQQNGITTYNPDAYIAAVRRCTNRFTPGPEPKSDVTGRAARVRPTDTPVADAADDDRPTGEGSVSVDASVQTQG
jgi:hypothetical protein